MQTVLMTIFIKRDSDFQLVFELGNVICTGNEEDRYPLQRCLHRAGLACVVFVPTKLYLLWREAPVNVKILCQKVSLIRYSQMFLTMKKAFT